MVWQQGLPNCGKSQKLMLKLRFRGGCGKTVARSAESWESAPHPAFALDSLSIDKRQATP